MEFFMKFTRIVFAAALLIGAAHVSDAQAMPTIAEMKAGAAARLQQARDAAGRTASAMKNSSAGQAMSRAGSAASNAAHNAANYVSHSSVGQVAGRAGHYVANKARSAGSSMSSAAHNAASGASRLMHRDR